MKRLDIIQGVNQIITAIEDSNLEKTLSAFRMSSARNDKRVLSTLLESLKKYSIYSQNFNEAAVEISSILHLDEINNTENWVKMLGSTDEPIPHHLIWSINFATEYLPKITTIIENEDLSSFRKSIDKKDPNFVNMDNISIIIVENKEHHFSNTTRITTVLEGTQLIYEASLALLDLPCSELGVLACDSGSDISFDLFGVADAIKSIKEIILSMWDRIVFYRESHLSVRMQLVSEALPIIEKITTMEKDGKIGREQAEILRRNITNGVEKLVSSGAIIPEVEQRSYYNPHTLMAPEQKLLTTTVSIDDTDKKDEKVIERDTNSTENKSHESTIDSLEKLSDDDKKQLLKLMRKLNRPDAAEENRDEK